jgi:hypothetical protein
VTLQITDTSKIEGFFENDAGLRLQVTGTIFLEYEMYKFQFSMKKLSADFLKADQDATTNFFSQSPSSQFFLLIQVRW